MVSQKLCKIDISIFVFVSLMIKLDIFFGSWIIFYISKENIEY